MRGVRTAQRSCELMSGSPALQGPALSCPAPAPQHEKASRDRSGEHGGQGDNDAHASPVRAAEPS